MSYLLELRQKTIVGTVQINGTILPIHSSVTIYDRPRIQAMLGSPIASDVVHIMPIADLDWVFALTSFSLSKLIPRFYANDWPPKPVGQKHLEKPGVHVLVSSDPRGIVWVNDKNGLHQIETSSLPYTFEEGELSVKNR